MMLLRSKEEVVQSEKEMSNYVKSLSGQITSLKHQMLQNISLLHTTSTSKEIKIAQQKNVIALAEKNRLNELLVLAVSKFQKINGTFVKETNTTLVSIIPASNKGGSKEENDEEDFTDDFTDDEEVDNYDEEELDDWSDEENNSNEDMCY